MLVGHVATAFLAKRVEPKISLGTAVLAAMLADVIWTIATIAGLEHASFNPGARGAANYLVISEVSWSHSLVMDVLWGGLFSAIYFASRHSLRTARLLFVVVVGHWLLDVVSHRPDMPLAPGLPARLGIGLWASVPATLVVEGGMWLGAIVLYLRTTRSKGHVGTIALWTGAALLTVIWYDNVAGLPHGVHPDPIGSLLVFAVFIAWAYWVDGAVVIERTAPAAE